mmetsp:Transcript_38243/g.85188  ORF Transcript_38243/g.85188 Transcript_38243/m.85188 type:complete len:96 (+) Transcript_38243:96-383(+)
MSKARGITLARLLNGCLSCKHMHLHSGLLCINKSKHYMRESEESYAAEAFGLRDARVCCSSLTLCLDRSSGQRSACWHHMAVLLHAHHLTWTWLV